MKFDFGETIRMLWQLMVIFHSLPWSGLCFKWSASNWVNSFEQNMCRERLYRMDWKAIMQPCKDKMSFGRKILWDDRRTDPKRSYILSRTIRPAGEYSTLKIQSVDKLGKRKTIGGDTWRVFVKGVSSLEPLVYDLNNGVYEATFLLLESGQYRVEIFLQGTLCSSYQDPPKDWFKKGDYNGHFQEDWMYKSHAGWPSMLRERQWQPLKGLKKGFSFLVKKADKKIFAENMERLQSWHEICGLNGKCNFLWDGYGRWIGKKWKPHAPESKQAFQPTKRKKKGTLWLYGDCYAYHFYETIWNKTLCHSVYQRCNHSYNWIYPRLHPIHEKDPSIHRKDPRDISISRLLGYLHDVLIRKDMTKDAVLLLNFGLHFARATSFENYKTLITRAIKKLKANFKGSTIWRTTTAVWKPEKKVHKRFQTYQRVLLFNAFAMEAMCREGIPIIDVFPMTASAPDQPEDGIHYDLSLMKPLEKILKHFVSVKIKKDGKHKRN